MAKKEYTQITIMLIPSCSYRIMFNPKFTFHDLAGVADYLADLGVTAIYASPILQPAKGSIHGYDGINPARLNPELGTKEELEVLSQLLQKKNIGWIQDIVPNHLAFDTNNVWLKDVLERGIYSPYAGHFDINWEHPFYQNKLMVPFLECDLGDCIKDERILLSFEEDGFFFTYYNNRYPVSPDSYPFILSGCFDNELNHINARINTLVTHHAADIELWCSLKADLFKQFEPEEIASRIRDKVEDINNDKETLFRLLGEQHYSLCNFRLSHTEINYRRFFNVNGLICLRIEEEKVFQDYHALTLELYQKGIIHGLRIDHIDGLKNPAAYIRRLRESFGDDCYIIVEKILDVKEELPDMDIQGTSGYEFLSYINQVLTDNRGAQQLVQLYDRHVPQFQDYESIVFANKLANLETYLNGEWDNLLRLLLSLNLIEDEEIKLPNLKMALGIFMAGFPVYRAYIEELPLRSSDQDLVDLGFRRALKRYPELHYELGVFIQLFEPHPDPVKHANRLLFVQRLMQFTGPIAAKGIEDTTFYQYNALISHNEVGDQPSTLGITTREFHEKMIERHEKNPYSFNCTSTHDTKRGEDNRIRINIISELASEWESLVAKWQKINEPFRKQIGEIRAPSVNDEYFLYQAITGGFPEDLQLTDQFVFRTKRYFTKVLRESKLHSDHINPNIPYEEASNTFIEHLLNPNHEYLPSLKPFVQKIIRYANIYTMVQAIIKTTAPGIPDVYEGCELWDLSYVDPDNRRQIDYILRKKLLMELKQKEAGGNDLHLHWARENFEIGTQKLLITWKVLQLRKQWPDLFLKGEYIPIYPDGGDRSVISFARHFENQWTVVILPVGIARHNDRDVRMSLPEGAPVTWKNIFSGDVMRLQDVPIADIFAKLEVAVFQNVDAE